MKLSTCTCICNTIPNVIFQLFVYCFDSVFRSQSTIIQSFEFMGLLTDSIHLTFKPGPEVIKLFSCSAEYAAHNVKMATFIGILTFISRINNWLS